MLSRRIATLISLSLLIALVTPLASVNADEKNGREEREVKCRSAKFLAQTQKRVNPPTNLLKRGPRLITLKTNCGNIVIKTYFRDAPVTLTVLSTLIKSGYYDRTACHRLTTEGIYVVQCGDPTATGMGDPGFRYKDENLPEAALDNYPKGVVAMANSGSPGTNGGQFFLVYEDTTLGPNYTIWGQIISGLDILEFVAKAGVKGGGVDGTPIRTLAIEKVVIR